MLYRLSYCGVYGCKDNHFSLTPNSRSRFKKNEYLLVTIYDFLLFDTDTWFSTSFGLRPLYRRKFPVPSAGGGIVGPVGKFIARFG